MSRNITVQSGTVTLNGARNSRTARPRLTTPVAEESPQGSIAAIGATAEGLPAIAELAARLPADFEPATVVVGEYPVHLLMDSLCQATRLPVMPAAHGLAVQPGTIYLNPEGALVTISGGIFHLTPAGTGHSHRIDTFFRSLAEDIGYRAIGVVFAGTGWDGAAGLNAIRVTGGITLTLSRPADSAHPGSLFPADYQLAAPEELASALQRLAGQKPPVSDEELEEIHRVLRRAESHDLRYLQPARVRRFVLRHMAKNGIGSASRYLTLLQNSEQEVTSLFCDLVAQTHGFFDEPAALDALQAAFGRTLWKERGPDEPFRIWVPGCSTGEESYSVAITVLEMLERSGFRPTVQIFSTDLLETSLQFARAGQYPGWIEKDVPAGRLSRFFHQQGSRYQVQAELRTVCLFARHNLFSDPPLARMDLIVFRNQLGSVSPAMQNRFLGMFHYSLKSGGALLLGKSDSLEVNRQVFEPLDGAESVYVPHGHPARPWFGVPVRNAEDTSSFDGDVPPVVVETQEPAAMTTVRPARTWEQTAKKAGPHLRELLEEQAETIEALKLANEEITCSNEELQVTVEELMAAREELQAANGELEIMNGEMQRRNQELSSLSSDLSALLRNIQLAVVTVDANLSIRYFTPESRNLFRLESTDRGRPVTDLNPRLQIPDLEVMLRNTIADLTNHERAVCDDQGNGYQIVIRPYRAEGNRIDGAILTAWPRRS